MTAITDGDAMSRAPSYGTAEFAALAELARWQRRRVDTVSLAARAMVSPALARRVAALCTLPVVEVSLSDDAARTWHPPRWVDDAPDLTATAWAQAILPLPGSDADYLRGPRRERVRTNLRRAADHGITAFRLDNYDAFRDAAVPVYRHRTAGDGVIDAMEPPCEGQCLDYYAAYVGSTPVAVAVVSTLGSFAALLVLVSDPTLPGASYSRYLLHTCIVCDLIERGLRFLTAGPALATADGLQYFQSLLGYRVCNVRLGVRPAGAARSATGTPLHRLLMRGPVAGRA